MAQATSDSFSERVRVAVGRVKDPALQLDLVTAGMLKAVEVDEASGRATVEIELTSPACPSRDVISKAVEDAVRTVEGVTAVEVKLSVKTRGRPNRPDNPRLPGVRNIIAVAAGKGGVGKSTVTTNLAAALRTQGASVGILDSDVYGPSIPQMLGDPEQPAGTEAGNKIVPAVHYGMKVISIGFFVERGGAVIWRGPMVHKLLQQFIEDVEWGELDYLLVDLPPGTGDAQLSLSQLLPITGAVMVTTPQEVSVIDVERGIAMFNQVNTPVLGLVENMSAYICPHCGTRDELFGSGGAERLARQFHIPVLGQIPIVPAIRESGDAGTPLVVGHPDHPVSKVYVAIAEQMLDRIAAERAPAPRIVG